MKDRSHHDTAQLHHDTALSASTLIVDAQLHHDTSLSDHDTALSASTVVVALSARSRADLEREIVLPHGASARPVEVERERSFT
jgi:hypothetical protein